MTYHKPVLVQEVITYMAPGPGKVLLDVTFGGGGHTRAMLEADPTCKVIALDWDSKALDTNAPALQEQFGDRLRLVWGNMAHLYKIVKKEKIGPFDGILADFGTSQFQIHERDGFSFAKNTPLDMRMSPAHQHLTAAEIVNTYDVEALANVFFELGEERNSRQYARAIVEARSKKAIKTTQDLVDIVGRITPIDIFRAKYKIHPATKIFQALRIAVNDELNNIKAFLAAALPALKPNGSLVCISFHSLEDRLVKNFFLQHNQLLTVSTRRPITAQPHELELNPSARSAKLRAAVKIA